jgi:hypothetical protein
MIKQLYLFSSSHCHLCEIAYSLAINMPDISVNLIDTADDELLFAQYGVRIPVLLRPDTGMELDWPFSEADIQKLLE